MSDSTAELLSLRALFADETEPARDRELRRSLFALALSSAFGAALGARFGVLSMAVHALGVPLGLAAVIALGAPACAIALAHAGARVPLLELGTALARSVAATGAVLAGLAPAMALVSVSVESPLTASVLGALGLALAGALGARRFAAELARLLRGAVSPLAARAVPIVFFVFAGALAARVWTGVLPMLGAGA